MALCTLHGSVSWAAVRAGHAAAAAACHAAPNLPPPPASCPSKPAPRLPLRRHHAGIMDELAQQYGFSYEVVKADIDEKAIRHEDAEHLVLRLAHAKAAAIADKLRAAAAGAVQGASCPQAGSSGSRGGGDSQGLLITCDQVPASARMWACAYRGVRVQACAGVCGCVCLRGSRGLWSAPECWPAVAVGQG